MSMSSILRGAMVVAAALAITGCLPRTVQLPSVNLPGEGEGRLAYLAPDGNVFIANRAGTETVQVTEDAAVEGDADYRVYGIPVWSPDGEHLAFSVAAGSAGQNPTTNQLLIANRTGDEVREVYTSDTAIIFYSWSPSSTHLGVLDQAASGQTLAMRRVALEGGEAETLDTGNPFYWSWGVNGDSVLIHTGALNRRLSILQLGQGVRERQIDLELGVFKAPAVSPDGTRALVGLRTSETEQTLVLVDLASGATTNLLTYQNEATFAWSPDGRWVTVLDTDGGLGTLTMLEPQNPSAAITVADQAAAFFWSPDSKRLAYLALDTFVPEDSAVSGDTQAEAQEAPYLMIVDAGSSESEQVSLWIPSPRWINQILPYVGVYDQTMTIWSPDSRYLAVPMVVDDQGTTAITVIDPTAGFSRQMLAEGVIVSWSWK